jgi:hypothetical protein
MLFYEPDGNKTPGSPEEAGNGAIGTTGTRENQCHA